MLFPFIVRLLEGFSPTVQASSPPAAKRAKTSEYVDLSSP